jgi:hypothetical protein
VSGIYFLDFGTCFFSFLFLFFAASARAAEKKRRDFPIKGMRVFKNFHQHLCVQQTHTHTHLSCECAVKSLKQNDEGGKAAAAAD